MSVENFDQLNGAVEFLDEAVPEDCFYCAKPLAGLTTFWAGGGAHIALHPECAIALGARLCRDGLNAKYLNENGSAMLGVAPGLGQVRS